MRTAVYEAATVQEVLAEIARADGHPPLSEHKMVTLGASGNLVGVWGDGVGICLIVAAVRHPGDGHWATEAALIPRRRTAGDEMAAIERAAGLAPMGEPHSFWAFRPGQVDAALRLGYVETRAILRMSGPMPVGAARSTPGISSGAMTARDVEGIVDVNNRAFAGHREQGSMTVDGFGSLMSLGWFDPTAVHVARSGERVVGFCVMKHEEPAVGEVYVLAVDPDLAGSGLGRALVQSGLANLADRGAVTAQAWVDAANDAAVGLYRSMGLVEDFRTREFLPSAGREPGAR
jgi:mycothiol synthase